MKVKLNAVTKVNGVWRQPGQLTDLSDDEAKRLIGLGAAVAVSGEVIVPQGDTDEVAAMRAELARLQEFERQQLAAAEAQAQKDEAERKPAEEAVTKGRGKAATKDDADGQTSGK